MVLSDGAIRRLIEAGRIGIDPYDESLMQPSSLDVRVARLFRVFRNSRYPYIDVKQAQEELTELVEVDDDEAFILHPGEFVLGSTLERVTLPDDLVARLEGKSSLGRLGLLIHSTAGFIDPGWDGHVTLELSNVANLPITIYPGMKIGQLSFVQLSEPAERPYGSGGLGSKYQGQRGPTPSAYWKNFADDMILVTGATASSGGTSSASSPAPASACRALVRGTKGAAALEGVDCELAVGDVTDEATVAAACDGCDAVVHLVAIIHGRPADFERVIAGGARNVAAAARDAGVRRIVLMSALGVSERDEGHRAVLPREVGCGAHDGGIGDPAHDPAAELRVRPRRRRTAALPAHRPSQPGDAGDRRRRAAAPADLGGRPRARGAARARRPTRSSSSSAGPTWSTGTSSGVASRVRSAPTGRRSTSRCGSCGPRRSSSNGCRTRR